jgi:hypothetical protein
MDPDAGGSRSQAASGGALGRPAQLRVYQEPSEAGSFPGNLAMVGPAVGEERDCLPITQVEIRIFHASVSLTHLLPVLLRQTYYAGQISTGGG